MLPEPERRVLELRFGFDGEPVSIEAIGKDLGVSRQRFHQLQVNALARLAEELERRRPPKRSSRPAPPTMTTMGN